MDSLKRIELGELIIKTMELAATIKANTDKIMVIKAEIEKHLRAADLAPPIPDFPIGLEWFNTSRSLSLKDFEGNITVLDFFTYCCINCMHILPDLEALEAQFPLSSGLVVVGVHSAKFDNEKVSANILSAIQRYNILHPVVNDSEAFLWKALNISCWPTVLVLGPKAQPLFCLVGEGHREELLQYIAVAFDYFNACSQITAPLSPFPLLPNAHVAASSTGLKFPGKIALLADSAEKLLAISDTGNNRIIIASPTGLIKDIVGHGIGFQDGNFDIAQFRNPQGLIWYNTSQLYVADTGNHVIRLIDFAKRTVQTVVGNGKQGGDKEGGLLGIQQVIASPWDLCFIPGPINANGTENCAILCIAMAGNHQIWGYFLQDTPWWKKSNYVKNTCVRLAGSGAEENRNNSYPHKAGFAQPSGLTYAEISGQSIVYIADSESSSIRQLLLGDGAVKAVVGGDRDPLNLFAFGDTDSNETGCVRLQHPLGVCWHSKRQLLYVADSYNHRIKTVQPPKNLCAKLTGIGEAGFADGFFAEAQFNEPGGLCVDDDEDLLYVADTNNHCIRVVDLKASTVNTLKLRKRQEVLEDCPDGREITVHLPFSKCELTWNWSIAVPNNVKLNVEAPSRYTIVTNSDMVVVQLKNGPVESLDGRVSLSFLPVREETFENVNLQIEVYLCNDQNLCFVQKPVLTLIVQREALLLGNSFNCSSVFHVKNLF